MFKKLKKKWKNRPNPRNSQKKRATDSSIGRATTTNGFETGSASNNSSENRIIIPQISVSIPSIRSAVSLNRSFSHFSLNTLDFHSFNRSLSADHDVLNSSGYTSLRPSATDLNSWFGSIDSLKRQHDSRNDTDYSRLSLNIYGNDEDWIQGDWIGRGSQAKVYLMNHKLYSDVHCVMKVVELSRDESDIMKIRQEYDMLSKLDHPRIIKYLWYTVDQSIREARIFMELMQVCRIRYFAQFKT